MRKLSTVLNKSLFEEHLAAGYKITTCPVCKNETFDDYFICPHCCWEYDGIIDEYTPSSTNSGLTVEEYREQFAVDINN